MKNKINSSELIGKTFWTVVDDCERESYNGLHPNWPRRPWRGQFIDGRNRFCSLGDDGTLDDDSNATAYIFDIKDLFETKADAMVGYQQKLKEYLEFLQKEMIQVETELLSYP